jgi:hypothetical protein
MLKGSNRAFSLFELWEADFLNNHIKMKFKKFGFQYQEDGMKLETE